MKAGEMITEIEISEGRGAPRYAVRDQLQAGFASYAISVVNLSQAGLLIEHAQPIRIGSTGRLAIQSGAGPSVLLARVVWSRLGNRTGADGRLLYRSGLLATEENAGLQHVIERLVGAGLASEVKDSLERKRQTILEKLHARKTNAVVKLVPVRDLLDPDRVMMVRHAIEQLRVHPDEATKWYNRAKFSGGGSGAVVYREEELAVWEYLERSVPLESIRQVLEKQQKS